MNRLTRLAVGGALALASAQAASAAASHWPLPPERTGLLYLSGYASNNIGEYAPDGTLLRTITATGLTRPRGIATDAEGNLVVVCEGSARILRLDLDGNILQTITHPDLVNGTGLAQSPNGDWYVGNFSPGRVLIFDEDWVYQSTLTFSGMNGVNCVAFESNGDFAVTAASSTAVYRFDAAHNHVGTVTHPQMSSPMSIALDSMGNHYVSQGGSGVVLQFDAAWNPLLSFGQGTLSSPQGVLVDEHDRLTITNFSAQTVHQYDTSGQLLGSWSLSGVTTARNATFQTSAKVLARVGTVNATSGYPEPTLTVRGKSADAMGRVFLGPSDPLLIELAASSAGPSAAPCVLWARVGEPNLLDVEVLPYGLGWFSFATPLGSGSPTTLTNSIGYPALLGTGQLPPLTAPGTVLDLPNGIGVAGRFTIQGLLRDDGAGLAPPYDYGVTNALVLIVR